VAVAGVLALPSGSSAKGSPYELVAGSGKVTFADFPSVGVSTTEQFSISAHDGTHGPSGTIVVNSPLYSINPSVVDVTCIVVDGNEARVGGKFREPFMFLGSQISHFGIVIRDNGSPGNGPPDEIHPVEFIDRPRPPTFSPCNLPPQVVNNLFPLDEGNYVLAEDGQ
jgi:hypothetical protein